MIWRRRRLFAHLARVEIYDGEARLFAGSITRTSLSCAAGYKFGLEISSDLALLAVMPYISIGAPAAPDAGNSAVVAGGVPMNLKQRLRAIYEHALETGAISVGLEIDFSADYKAVAAQGLSTCGAALQGLLAQVPHVVVSMVYAEAGDVIRITDAPAAVQLDAISGALIDVASGGTGHINYHGAVGCVLLNWTPYALDYYNSPYPMMHHRLYIGIKASTVFFGVIEDYNSLGVWERGTAVSEWDDDNRSPFGRIPDLGGRAFSGFGLNYVFYSGNIMPWPDDLFDKSEGLTLSNIRTLWGLVMLYQQMEARDRACLIALSRWRHTPRLCCLLLCGSDIDGSRLMYILLSIASMSMAATNTSKFHLLKTTIHPNKNKMKKKTPIRYMGLKASILDWLYSHYPEHNAYSPSAAAE